MTTPRDPYVDFTGPLREGDATSRRWLFVRDALAALATVLVCSAMFVKAMQDERPILRDGTPLVIGQTYEHTGKLVMCESGYHDSERVIDALRYAPGPYLCRTLVSADLRSLHTPERRSNQNGSAK